MTEFFLHYLWRYKAFEVKDLRTLSGDRLEILFAGVYNTGGGPDFLNARLRIGNTLWVGHVEIHVKASDWNRHLHQYDDHYKNVILHVVLENDESIYLFNEGDLPVLSLKNRFDSEKWNVYKRWQKDTSAEIICDLDDSKFDAVIWTSWKDRLLVERMEQKCAVVWRILDECGGYWPEVLYRVLAMNFGFNRNAEAFDLLAGSVPFKLLRRYKNDLMTIEALLFGQAGFLNDQVEDDYFLKLKEEYHHLQAKHRLINMNSGSWTFGGVRPSNFPTIRIAQFAALIHQSENLLAQILNEKDVNEMYGFFELKVSTYWRSHFRFGSTSLITSNHALSASFIENILMNTIAVVLFSFGRFNHQEELVSKGMRIFEHCNPEQNSIIKKWKGRGPDNKSGADSQALIQLFKKYCSNKKCLDCAIGHQQLKQIEKDGTGDS